VPDKRSAKAVGDTQHIRVPLASIPVGIHGNGGLQRETRLASSSAAYYGSTSSAAAFSPAETLIDDTTPGAVPEFRSGASVYNTYVFDPPVIGSPSHLLGENSKAVQPKSTSVSDGSKWLLLSDFISYNNIIQDSSQGAQVHHSATMPLNTSYDGTVSEGKLIGGPSF